MTEISLRLASPEDRADLERLAALDERPLPSGPHLIASCDGEPVAALSLQTGTIVADPFRRTREAQRLLRCHWGRVGLGSNMLEWRPASSDADGTVAVGGRP
jgi:hypothetical protein